MGGRGIITLITDHSLAVPEPVKLGGNESRNKRGDR